MDDAREVGAAPQAIQRGQLELGYPEVGNITATADSVNDCTATLIDPSFIVTARHCGESWKGHHRFWIRDAEGTLLERSIDKKFRHPSRDLAVFHLTEPVEGVPVATLDATPLQLQQECFAVGFGRHTEDGVTTSGEKRSCTEIVSELGEEIIVVRMGSGIADHGDSGGPLFCSKRADGTEYEHAVAAVVKNHLGEDYETRGENYTLVDVDWVRSQIANFDPNSPPDPISNDGVSPPPAPEGPRAHLTSTRSTGALCPDETLLCSQSNRGGVTCTADPELWTEVETEAPSCKVDLGLSLDMPADMTEIYACVALNFGEDQPEPVSVQLQYTSEGQPSEPFEYHIEPETHNLWACERLKLRAAFCQSQAQPPSTNLSLEIRVQAATGQFVQLDHWDASLGDATLEPCGEVSN